MGKKTKAKKKYVIYKELIFSGHETKYWWQDVDGYQEWGWNSINWGISLRNL